MKETGYKKSIIVSTILLIVISLNFQLDFLGAKLSSYLLAVLLMLNLMMTFYIIESFYKGKKEKQK